MQILLPHDVKDSLIDRLDANHKAHKNNTPFHTIRRRLERNAQTTFEGVWVDRDIVRIARDAIAKNVQFAGAKYQSGFDEILLFDLDEALVQSPRQAPLQSLQQGQAPPKSPQPDAQQTPEPHRNVDENDLAPDNDDEEEIPFLDLSHLPDPF